MQCVSGLHLEAIDLITPQWWNQCSQCGQMGLNYESQEAWLQKFENGKPVIVKTEKGKSIVMEQQPHPEPISCKACGHGFTKR